MDITVTEIMELADLHAHAKVTDGTPAELLPRNLLQHKMQEIFTDFFILQCKLIEARREIVFLQAQLEAVAAVPDGWRLVPVQPEIQAVLHMLDVPVLAYISSHSEKLGKTTADFDTFESAIPLVSQHAHRAACEKVISAMQAQLEAVGAGRT